MLFGGAIAQGLLAGLSWPQVAFAAIVLVAVRPIATAIGFVGASEGSCDRAAFGYFGIRGLGSLYYASYVTNLLKDQLPSSIWPTVGFTVLASVLLFGITGDVVMRLLERRRPASID